MMPRNRNIVPIVFISLLGGIFAFSAYVFLTTENTVIVINEASSEPAEVFVEGAEHPDVEEAATNPRIRILETGVGFLNVRDGASTQARQVGRVAPGDVYEYTLEQGNWYRIVHPEFDPAWVSGQYVAIVAEDEG